MPLDASHAAWRSSSVLVYTLFQWKNNMFIVIANSDFKTNERTNYFRPNRPKIPKTAPRPPKTASRSPQDRSEIAPRPPKTAQRPPKDCPRPSQDRPKTAQDRQAFSQSNNRLQEPPTGRTIQHTNNKPQQRNLIYKQYATPDRPRPAAVMLSMCLKISGCFSGL